MKLLRSLCLIFVSFLLLADYSAIAQTQAPIYWYFGNNNNGFRFIRPDYTAEATTIPNGLFTGMSGVATDPATGVLLFYTDGVNVYNREHTLMPNGTGLSGSPTLNQGVALSANPAVQGEYFIFTNNGSIEYTTVDMGLDAANAEAIPRGSVVAKNQGIPGLAGTYDPAMIVLPKTTRDGFWLILHPTGGGASFQVVDINAAGFTVMPLATVTPAPTFVDNFSYNPLTGQLAMGAFNNTLSAYVDFDVTTGFLGATATVIPGTDTSIRPYNIYDTEWSNDGRYLYLSGNFGTTPDALMQVDLTESPLQLRRVPTQNLAESYGLQMAPDSSIYHLYRHSDGTYRTGRIEDPDTIAAQTRYVANAFGPINYQGRQFPSFLPPFDPMMMVSFEVSGICSTVPSVFMPTIMPGADSVYWDFGDGGSSTDLAPFYTYQQGGNYTVTLTAFLNGEPTSAQENINITQFDLSISGFPDSDTVCAEDFPVMYTAEAQSQGTPPTFQWSNNPLQGPTTTVDSAGSFYVTAEDALTGCVAYKSLRVVEYRARDQRAFIWYFGQNAGIDFNPIAWDNPGPAVPIPYGDPTIYNGGDQMNAPEGCAIFCDNNGQPLFYSDGEEIYDREGNLLANGIGGSKAASQSVFITEFPGDGTLFYVFLTREVYDLSGAMSYELNYVIFDLKQRNGLGDLIRDASNQVITTKLYTRNTERITGSNNWVIAHEWGNNNFRAYRVTGTGILPAVISNVGSVHSSNTSTSAQGYMKLAPIGKLAVAVSKSATENYVELFDFDNQTGAVTNPLRLDLTGETGQVYGVEFSSDYRKLFATVRNPAGGGPSKLYRWQIDTTTVAGTETDPSFIINSKDLVETEAGEDLGAIQQGPDGQLYIAREGSPNLAIVSNPNADMTITPMPDPGFQLDGFGLGEDLVNGGFTLSHLGLPNFANQYMTSPQEIQLNVFSGCIGETLSFNVLNQQSLETYRWTIFDTDSIVVATGVGEEFDFTTMTPGEYTAYVEAIPECQIVESMPLPAEEMFTVGGDPLISLTNITNPSACGGDDGAITVEINEAGSFAFEFSGPIAFVSDTLAGPVSEIVTDLPSGTYNVYAINTLTGCQSAASATLSDNGVRFTVAANVVSDATCDGAGGSVEVSLLPDAGYTIGYPVNYVLRPEGTNNGVITGTYANGNGLQVFSIDDIPPGTYNLEVTELSGDGCTQTLDNIVIAAPPTATLDLPSEVLACDETEVLVPFTTNAPGIRVVDPAPGNYEIINGQLTVFAPGTWTLETVEEPDLCARTASVEVIFATSDPLPSSIESTYAICPEDPVEDNRTAVIDPGNAVYESIAYFDAEGAEITGSGPDYSLSGDVLTVYVPGPVIIEMTNVFGCVTRETVDVILSCEPSITAPEAFRPNSTIADNTVWRLYPFLVSPEGFQVFIFNRWGELIAQSGDLDFQWNGGYDNDEGRPAPGGAYAYRVIYNSINNDGSGPREERGAIILIR